MTTTNPNRPWAEAVRVAAAPKREEGLAHQPVASNSQDLLVVGLISAGAPKLSNDMLMCFVHGFSETRIHLYSFLHDLKSFRSSNGEKCYLPGVQPISVRQYLHLLPFFNVHRVLHRMFASYTSGDERTITKQTRTVFRRRAIGGFRMTKIKKNQHSASPSPARNAGRVTAPGMGVTLGFEQSGRRRTFSVCVCGFGPISSYRE